MGGPLSTAGSPGPAHLDRLTGDDHAILLSQMLKYTTAGSGARMGLLVLHGDPVREYAYGPAQGLPDTRVGTALTQALYGEAKKDGWMIISRKNDWTRIFSFE